MDFTEPESASRPLMAGTWTIDTRIECQAIHSRSPLRKGLSKLLDGAFVTCFSMICLVVALFGSAVVILLDLPDDPTNAIMDAIMVSILVFFIVECCIRSYCQTTLYFLSFFFWMDVLGSLSMVFDISFLLGDAGKPAHTGSTMSTAVMMRAARTARVGARAGRVLKPIRWLAKYFAPVSTQPPSEEEAELNLTKMLGARLTRVLATQVALLTVVLVLGVPFFSIGCYPVDDFSGQSWAFQLTRAYNRSYSILTNSDRKTTDVFETVVLDMLHFYENFAYTPFELVGCDEHVIVGGIRKTIPGETLVTGRSPIRKQNIVIHDREMCVGALSHCELRRHAALKFDFTSTNQYAELMHMGVTLFIVVCMVIESFDLSRLINDMVMRPLGKTIEAAKSLAEVFKHSDFIDTLYNQTDADDEEQIDGMSDEAAVLQQMFHKTARLSKVLLKRKFMDAADVEHLSEESKGVLHDMLDVHQGRVKRRASTTGIPSDILKSPTRPDLGLQIDAEEIQSWGFNLLDQQPAGLQNIAMYIMFDTSIGVKTGRAWSDDVTFREFLARACRGYNANPYHNFHHACDVLASLTRILDTMQWQVWLSDVDTYALLVAALCHDIGHQGKTNPFLVETRDTLALRYNDKSPLENMHCATMFELSCDPKANVFQKFRREDFKQVRTVCIGAILHTDNAVHFDIVKEIQSTSELTSELCRAQANTPDDLRDDYVAEVLTEHMQIWLKLVLHLADVSNPVKTFEMNQRWADRVVDELFEQGDAEKKLGIPVGMLNDRDKINRAGAEHGFIVFLVAPLMMAVVNVFPVCLTLAQRVASNVEDWRNVWVNKANPPEEEIKKRDADVNRIKDQVRQSRPMNLTVPQREHRGRSVTVTFAKSVQISRATSS